MDKYEEVIVMNQIERKIFVENAFVECFGYPPTVWVHAPGRVDLMGSHTDYNEGFVMTMTIDRETWIALCPRNDHTVQISSLNLSGQSVFTLDHLEYDESISWTNYIRGVAKILQEEGYALQGFDGLIHSTIPFGSGLSSSAALEVAIAIAFKTLSNLDIDPVQIALFCQRAENEFVGMNCGILDQYSSVFGEAGCSLVLDCRILTHQLASIPEDVCIVICDTRAKRELTGSEYPERRAQCEEGARLFATWYSEVKTLRDVNFEQFADHKTELPERVARRSQFIIEENQRVLELAEALSCDDREAISQLTVESYAGACDLFEIGTSEMEAMMNAMQRGSGIIGARQAGAGFGGCMIAFVEQELVEAFAENVSRDYLNATGIQPEIYPVQAAPGAGVLQV
jgi:galactokinase